MAKRFQNAQRRSGVVNLLCDSSDDAGLSRATESPLPGCGRERGLAAPPPTHADHWSAARRAKPLKQLLPGTRRWADSLPDSSKPWQLMLAYPRIANRIAGAWHERPDALTVLDDLIIDRRGGRRGFSPFVFAELVSLRELVDRRR